MGGDSAPPVGPTESGGGGGMTLRPRVTASTGGTETEGGTGGPGAAGPAGGGPTGGKKPGTNASSGGKGRNGAGGRKPRQRSNKDGRKLSTQAPEGQSDTSSSSDGDGEPAHSRQRRESFEERIATLENRDDPEPPFNKSIRELVHLSRVEVEHISLDDPLTIRSPWLWLILCNDAPWTPDELFSKYGTQHGEVAKMFGDAAFAVFTSGSNYPSEGPSRWVRDHLLQLQNVFVTIAFMFLSMPQQTPHNDIIRYFRAAIKVAEYMITELEVDLSRKTCGERASKAIRAARSQDVSSFPVHMRAAVKHNLKHQGKF